MCAANESAASKFDVTVSADNDSATVYTSESEWNGCPQINYQQIYADESATNKFNDATLDIREISFEATESAT